MHVDQGRSAQIGERQSVPNAIQPLYRTHGIGVHSALGNNATDEQ